MQFKTLFSTAAAAALFLTVTATPVSSLHRGFVSIQEFVGESVEDIESSSLAKGLIDLKIIAKKGISQAAQVQLKAVNATLSELTTTMSSEQANIPGKGDLNGGDAYKIGGIFLKYSTELQVFLQKTAAVAPNTTTSSLAQTLISGLGSTMDGFDSFATDLRTSLDAEPHFLTKIDSSIKAADDDFEAAVDAYRKFLDHAKARLSRLRHGALRV